jgi:hypothetical protein
MKAARIGLLAWLAIPCAALAPAARLQTEADEYTRYELLEPESARFRILYEVSATTRGAELYFNPIRKGSEASDEAVYDRVTGRALSFTVVGGAAARAGGHPEADPATSYLRIVLPRAVPKDGEVRLLIDKTYRDPKSYYVASGRIVFSRSLGVKRNAVVLPKGYELVYCNVPSQVLSEPDGRILVSFMNASAAEAPLMLEARKLP